MTRNASIRAWVWLPILFAATACDCGVKTGRTSNGITLVDPPGDVTQFERNIDLGAVRVSNIASHKVLLQNTGRLSASITSASLTPESSHNFYLKLPATLPVNMAPGDSFEAELRYQPSDVGSDSGTIIIQTSAPATPQYTIHVTGSAGASKIDVCSTDAMHNEICALKQADGKLVIDFGLVKPPASEMKPLVVKSIGNLNLQVTSVKPTMMTTSDYTVQASPLPASLAPQKSASYSVSFSPSVGGEEDGAVEIVSDDPITPRLVVLLKGIGQAPRLCVDPTSVEFGDQTLGTTGSKTLRLISCGAEAVTVTTLGLVVDGSTPANGMTPLFALAGPPTLPLTLQVNASLDLSVTYTPKLFGDDTGLIAITTADGERGRVPLHGHGVGCSLTITPNPVAFGNVSSGAGRTSKILQVRNAGSGACTITAIAPPATAAFTLDKEPKLPDTIAPGQSDTVTVTFAPPTDGPYQDKLVFSSNDSRGNITVPLGGNGIPRPECDLQAQPTALYFAGVSPGQMSTQNVTLTNYGTNDCYIASATMQGMGATSFSVAVMNFPPTSISSGANYTMPVTFAPKTAGNEAATLHIVSSTQAVVFGIPTGGTMASLDIALQGGTLDPKLCVTPASLDFGSVAVGASKDLVFTLSSCGPGTISLRGLKMESGSSKDFTITTAVRVPQFLPSGQSIPVTVHFAPHTATPEFGQALVLSNDPSNPQGHVQMQGNAGTVCAKQLACGTDKLTFATMEVGRSTSLSLVCVNVGTQPLTVTGSAFSPQTSPAFTVSLGTVPAILQPGDSVRVSVTYVPQTAGADSGAIIIDSDACAPASVDLEGTGKAANYPQCLPPQVFQPVVKWSWNGGTTQKSSQQVEISPLVVNLDDDNGDGLVNENDIPEVVFSSCSASECTPLNIMNGGASDVAGVGIARAIHGKDGSEFWTVADPAMKLTVEAQMAVADLDGDNLPEIIAVKHCFNPNSTSSIPFFGHYVSGTLLVFDHTGKLEFETDAWTGDQNSGEMGSAPTIGDIDGDGKPEIVFERTVFHYDGTKWFDTASSGNDGHAAIPSLADLNGDGKLEISSGRYVFEMGGTQLWAFGDATANGPTAIVDVDGDGLPEVLLRPAPDELDVLDGATGKVKYGPFKWQLPVDPMSGMAAGICSAPIAAADLDGDGHPDAIIPSGNLMHVFNILTGKEMWNSPIDDWQGQCGASGTAAFDFNGDGKFDVVYHDVGNIYVFNGPDGQLMYKAPRNSVTLFETPVIADVDNDGHADILMTNQGGFIGGLGGLAGLQALSNVGNNWPATRRIWNEHAYHQSNVNENDSVPRVEAPFWKTTNNWRAQQPLCRP
jgi:hypothetical protein